MRDGHPGHRWKNRQGGGDTDAIVKELGANLICANARFVPAGIVAANRAQEHGYSSVSPG